MWTAFKATIGAVVFTYLYYTILGLLNSDSMVSVLTSLSASNPLLAYIFCLYNIYAALSLILSAYIFRFLVNLFLRVFL